MSISYSYGTLSAALQAWSDINSPDVIQSMPDIMQKGELRLYHALDLDNLDPVLSTGAVNGLTGIVSKPSNLIRERTLSLTPPAVASTVKLLLHFQGATGSTIFNDSTYNDVWTPSGATITNTVAKFGSFGYGSMNCPGPNNAGQVITTPSFVGCPLDPGTGNMTFEGWFYITSAPSGTPTIIDFSNSYATGFRIYLVNSGTTTRVEAQFGPVLAGTVDSPTVNSSTILNQWNHFAMVRSGNFFTVYLNGVAGNVFTSSLTLSPSAPGIYYIGGGYLAAVQNAFFVGNLSELRMSMTAVYGANFTPPTAPFANPVVPAGGSTAMLRKCSYEFATQYLIDYGVTTAPPKYYCELSSTQWQLAPLPDQLYTLNVRGIYRPTLLGDNPEVTNLSGIVASQHTTGGTALTLVTSPFVYANAAPSLPSSQVWLYSAGNMAANSFTIVGLDDDGNAQTEIVVGPSAGSVQSVGFYSQITTITPTTTDSSNSVSVGWSQDNQTWLSSRFGDLLFWYCMVEICQFNKRWSAAKEAQEQVDALLPFAQMITRNLKRNDYDDLYSGRQNVGSPGAVPLPVPPQSGMPQGQ